MRYFAKELSDTIHNIESMSTVGIKIASAESASMAQNAVASCCDAAYVLLEKKAMEYTDATDITPVRMATFITKIAEVLNKPAINDALLYKLSAAVMADNTYTLAMKNTPEISIRTKYANARTYGREFFVNLLCKAI